MMAIRKSLSATLGTWFISLLVWGYAAVLLFTWYAARELPDRLVLLRVGASIVSDLVWLPFGMAVWGAIIYLLIRRLKRPVITSVVMIAAMSAILADHHTAFRWMFAPLAADIVIMLYAHFRHRIGAVVVFPILVVTIIIIGYYRGLLLPSPGRNDNADVKLKVMSYNIYSRTGTSGRSLQIETIRRENPDIVCLVEYNPRTDLPLLKEQLGDRYPYMVSNRRDNSWNSGEIVLSCYPITSKQIVAIPGQSYDMDFMFSEVDVNGRTINLVTFHLITVGHEIIDQVFSKRSYSERIEAADRSEREKDRIKFEQARELIDFAAKLEDPIILCGDMNDTPNSRTYRLFSEKFTNTFKAAGWGLGDTFGEFSLSRRLKPLVARDVIRIDQIFVDEEFRVLSAEVIRDAEGSDHKPVVATVSLHNVPRSE